MRKIEIEKHRPLFYGRKLKSLGLGNLYVHKDGFLIVDYVLEIIKIIKITI